MAARERLIDFYLLHNPAKLCDIDTILESFEGHEDEMFEALEKKYAGSSSLEAAASAAGSSSGDVHSERANGSQGAFLRESFEKLQLQLARLVGLDLLSKLSQQQNDPAMQETISTVATFQNMAANFVEDCISVMEKLGNEASTQSGPNGKQQVTSVPPPSRSAERADGTRQVEVIPTDGSVGKSLLTTIIASGSLQNGDVLAIHPGTYYENLRAVGEMKLELRPAFSGAVVSILPLDDSLPCITVEGHASVRLVGLLLATRKRAVRDTVPLLSCIGGTVELERCQLVGGGGGVVATSNSTVVMSHSTIKGAAFAGIYLKEGAFGSLSDCEIVSSEVGVRARDSSFSLIRSSIQMCSSDGVTCHGTVQGVLEGSTITNCKDNGLMLSPASAVMITSCSISGCAQYGVYAPSGADFALVSTKLSGNALGDYSRAPPALSLLDQTR